MIKRIVLFVGFNLAFFCNAQLDYSASKYNEKNGFFSSNTKSIVHDKYGFAWIGTQDGLFFFDGKNFKTVSGSAKANKVRDVQKVVYDSLNNCIWVAYFSGGLEAIDCGTHLLKNEVFLINNGHKSNISGIYTLITLGKGNLLVGNSEGFFRVRPDFGKSITTIESSSVKKVGSCSFLQLDQDSCFAFIEGKGLCQLNSLANGGFKILAFSNILPDAVFMRNKICFIATKGKLISYNLLTGKSDSMLINLTVTGINKWDADKILLTSSTGSYVADFNRHSFDPIKFWVKGIADERDYIITSTWDNNNNLWIGNSKSLLISHRDKPFIIPFSNSNQKYLDLGHVYQIAPVSENEILIGDLNGCFYFKKKENKISILNKNSNTFLIAPLNKNEFIYSSNKGFNIIEVPRMKITPIESKYAEWHGIDQSSIFHKIKVSDNIDIIAKDKNVFFIWDKSLKKIQTVTVNEGNGFADKRIFSLYMLSQKEFLVFQQNGIVNYNITNSNRKVYQYTYPGTSEKIAYFFDACVVDGEIWVATYGFGILKLNRNMTIAGFINTENGLSNNAVYRLLYDSIGNVWASTNNGLNRITLSTGHVTNYYFTDGLHSNMLEQYSAGQYGKSIYFGGVNGFSEIVPANVTINDSAPSVMLCNIEYSTSYSKYKRTFIEDSVIDVPNNIQQTNLYVCATGISDNLKYRLYYKISGINDQWIPVDEERKIVIMGYAPATYKLSIGIITGGNSNMTVRNFKIIILPKWYQTWWFYSLIVLMVTAILYALYRYRIRQIKKQHEIRKNIATDLHDDLGSTLNSVKVFTNLAISGVKQEESLQQVKDNLTEATMSLRDMIWVLDDSLDTVDELVTRLKQFALPITAAISMEFIITAGSDVNARTLSKEEKRNLFLICKEAINNSIKYSGASQITVDITPAGKKIQIIVADNGKGFDETTVKKGYGLKNMQYRAGQVKYTAEIFSQTGKGSQIRLIPA